jgi:pimeloyl-ACP methyl ester carboxylesterase
MNASSIPLAHREAGSGLPLVFLHGFPLSHRIWEAQLNALSDRCRVIAPDLRGHGQSPAPEGPYPMETMAGDVLALLDSLRVPRAVILGHSMGGYVTLALWRLAPERVVALGLVGSQAGADTEEVRKGRLATAEKVAASGAGVVADAMIPKLFAPGTSADSALAQSVRQIILSTSPTGIRGTLHGMAARPDSTPLLAGMEVPTLFLCGEQDQIIPLAKSEAMAAAAPRATLAPIPNAGHMPMLEQPDAVTQAIRQFLQPLLA